MSRRADLHTHSRYSDGTSTPLEVVERALKSGVETLVLTDHDTVSGFPEALAAAKGTGLELFCGIEINTVHKDGVHILGYGIRWQDPAFLARLSQLRDRRVTRVRRIVEKLRAHGVDLSFEDVEGSGHQTLGRPHVADALKKKGVVASRQQAFDRFLIRGKPGYVESMGPTPEEAISLIRDAGGFSSLAHPQTVSHIAEIESWIALGLEGIEVYYSTHHPSQVKEYLGLADSRGLLATGGSDYHGPGSGRDKRLGVDLPDAVYGRFMERLARCS